MPLKGLVPLLEAVAKLRTERPEVELHVVGGPRQGSTIPAHLDRLGLPGAAQGAVPLIDLPQRFFQKTHRRFRRQGCTPRRLLIL